MAENRENYFAKNLWPILQTVLGVYVAGLATWELFHPKPIPASVPGQNPAPAPPLSDGATVTSTGCVMPFWLWAGIILLVLSVLIPAILKLIRGWKGRSPRQSTGIVPGIPTLSALLGQDPNVDFNARQFFALSYYSTTTAEVEKNIKIAAQRNSPNDKEAFYARLIGVGLIAYQHDITSYTIYGSQVAALSEMNSRGLIPIADLRKHYDKACADYPATYTNYSFEKWLEFMRSRSLIAVYPSLMVELSFGGKDFLRYMAHAGRDINGKPN